MSFDLHTAKSAPEGSRHLLEGSEKKIGFVPNLLATLAESPAALQAYSNLAGALQHSADFSAAEQQVLFLAVSFENECDYCMAAHSAVASNGILTNGQLQSLREGSPLADDRLEALRHFATVLVQKRGWLDETEVHAFLNAGFSRRQVLDVVTAITLKTLTNLTNHLAHTPVDEEFASFVWRAPARA